ncbi:LacI family DNA-binding transcriptional regulator [Levilactobacillus brevis]|uniref:LacI family DNA-binding transcriptional regulator n=1 Tax=Levilactobacillus brevis TaxID=1580 RepID=UPI00339BBB96
MKNTTIADVAAAADVSVTTVSRYLNGNYQKMSAATKQRIKETIATLHYAPKASARKMRQDHSQLIGVVVGDIANVFSSLLFKGIYDVLQPAGYDVLLMNANNTATTEHGELTRLAAQQVDGIILQPSAATAAAYAGLTIPTVIVDRQLPNSPLAQVLSSNFDASYQLGQHLREQGYRRLITVGRAVAPHTAQTDRLAGLTATGLSVIHLDMTGHGAPWLTQQLRQYQQAPDKPIIISLMGPLLFEILASLKAAHLHFPADVGLVSFDDWQWSQYVNDGIYLLQQQPALMGQLAATTLLHQLTTTPTTMTQYVPVAPVVKPSL